MQKALSVLTATAFVVSVATASVLVPAPAGAQYYAPTYTPPGYTPPANYTPPATYTPPANYVAPSVYPPAGCYGGPTYTPPTAYNTGCYPPQQWVSYCAGKYANFNVLNGYFQANDGYWYPCT